MPRALDLLREADSNESPARTGQDEELVLGQVIRDGLNRADAGPHDEVSEMHRAVDLLSLIRQDTGESGSGSGGTIYFKSCPICGHSNCFRFYPSTNSWSCFGGSNDNANAEGRDGGGYIQYLIRTNRARDNAEAVGMLRAATGNERGLSAVGQVRRETPAKESAGGTASTETGFVPELFDGNQLLHMSDEKPDWLLRGVYARGDVVLITGPSGLGKTHIVMELCVAHATCGEVLGHVAEQARVIAIDPEMRPDGLARRIHCVAEHYNATEADLCRLKYICTRVAPQSLGNIEGMLAKLKHEERPDVLILDSISVITAMDDLDENSNPAVTRFLINVKALAKRYDCAVVAMHHPPKNAGVAYANAGTLIRGAESWRAGADNVFELIPLRVEEGTGAWELQKKYGWRSVNEHDESVTRYPRAVRMQCTKFRYDAEPRPVNMLFRPPIHVVDLTGELGECSPAFDRPSDKGGAATKHNADQRRKSEEEALYGIVHDFEARGTEPKSELVVEQLNRWRNENGMKRTISADTLERYATEGRKRKYFKVCCVDGVFQTVGEDVWTGQG